MEPVIFYVIVFITVASAIGLVVLYLTRDKSAPVSKSDKAFCSASVLGLVVDCGYDEKHKAETITVEYEVKEKKYRLTEVLKPHLNVKSMLRKEEPTYMDVCYDPDDPTYAYLSENI